MSPITVPAGTRIRALYTITPRPAIWEWLALVDDVRALWAAQPGISIGKINANTRGIGVRTDEFFVDAVATAPVDPGHAFSRTVQFGDDSGDIYTLFRAKLDTWGPAERDPTAGETFGETDWWELPLWPIRQLIGALPLELRWIAVLALLVALVYGVRKFL